MMWVGLTQSGEGLKSKLERNPACGQYLPLQPKNPQPAFLGGLPMDVALDWPVPTIH